MPLKTCENDKGDPGYKWGESGRCYAYKAGDESARKQAKRKAILQGAKIEGGKLPPNPQKVMGDDGRELAQACRSCGETKSDRSFRVDGRFKNNLAPVCNDCAADAELSDDDVAVFAEGTLETVDLEGVEILKAGGPYFGKGSPKEGDTFTAADMERFAKNTALLMERGELKSPNKIGHSKKQALAKNSGLALEDDEQPAVGWLANTKAKGESLYTDLKKVPKKLADLIQQGAFRTRSVELQNVTSQTDGKKYTVIAGLAWLGAKAPAVRTLDDVAALYSEQDDDEDLPPGVRFVDFAAGDIVWNPATGFGYLRDKLNSALRGPGPNGPYYWVMDVSLASGTDAEGDKTYVGLVRDDKDDTVAWLVPFDIDTEGDVHPAPSSDWTMAQQAWVESASAYSTRPADETGGASDSSAAMAAKPEAKKSEPVQLSDEQVDALAKTFEIDEADAQKRRELVVEKVKGFQEFAAEPAEGETKLAGAAAEAKPAEDARGNGETQLPKEFVAEYEVMKAKAERGDRAFEERRVERRDTKIEEALRAGKIAPAKVDFWKGFADENEARAFELIDELPIDENLVRVYGSDDDGSSDEGSLDRVYAAHNAAMGFGDLEVAD